LRHGIGSGFNAGSTRSGVIKLEASASINGAMGRLGLRAAWGWDGLEFVRINEIATGAAGSAHLLKFDSVHGVWKPECSGEGEEIRIDDKVIAYSRNPVLADTDWSAATSSSRRPASTTRSRRRFRAISIKASGRSSSRHPPRVP
jgi:hypothetical protein